MSQLEHELDLILNANTIRRSQRTTGAHMRTNSGTGEIRAQFDSPDNPPYSNSCCHQSMTHAVRRRPEVGGESARRPRCRRARDAALLRGENALYRRLALRPSKDNQRRDPESKPASLLCQGWWPLKSCWNSSGWRQSVATDCDDCDLSVSPVAKLVHIVRGMKVMDSLIHCSVNASIAEGKFFQIRCSRGDDSRLSNMRNHHWETANREMKRTTNTDKLVACFVCVCVCIFTVLWNLLSLKMKL